MSRRGGSPVHAGADLHADAASRGGGTSRARLVAAESRRSGVHGPRVELGGELLGVLEGCEAGRLDKGLELAARALARQLLQARGVRQADAGEAAAAGRRGVV